MQLRGATLPRPLSTIALHGWFVLFDPETEGPERWEVWQERERGGTSWAHLHHNLMHPDRPVGGGPTFVEREWTRDEARALAAVLRDPLRYPFRERYRAWPGPNSNTYVAWALREAGLEHALDPRAIGKDYLGRYGFGARRCGAGWQVACPLVGFKMAPGAFELHLLCLTLGHTHGGLLTPFGRSRKKPTGDPPELLSDCV